MDLNLIERLMQLLENSSVNELEVTEGNLHIRMAKTVTVAAPASPPLAATAIEEAPANVSLDDGLHVIVAGLPGTFYRAPAPGTPPFVQPGDRIHDGQQIGIVEAMKMMNPVEADCDGTIAEILLEDAAPVMAGARLFRIRKD
jgi:acetyl-CoA carboxylase biotin carboxyl carrier protein